MFFFLRVRYQSQIFSADIYKVLLGFSLKYSINTNENAIFFNTLFLIYYFTWILISKRSYPLIFPKYFLSKLVFENIFCELNSRNLPLFPPLVQGGKITGNLGTRFPRNLKVSHEILIVNPAHLSRKCDTPKRQPKIHKKTILCH